MTDFAPTANARPRLLTIVLLPSQRSDANNENHRGHIYEEANTSVPSGRQKDINEDNRKFQQYDGEFVLLPPDQKKGSNDDSKRYVLLPYQGNIKDSKQYATVLFPDSYEAAVDAAFNVFGHYMPATANRENVEMLFPVANNEGEQVWSVFDATTWAFVMEETSGKMLGIRQKIAVIDEEPFITGVVALTYGTFKDGATKWVSVKVDAPTCSPRINRPKTFFEAVDFVKLALPSLSLIGFPKISIIDTDMEFKFYAFTSSKNGKQTTDCWVAFPDEAYHSDTVWRGCVPKPFEILGFTLEQRSKRDGKALEP